MPLIAQVPAPLLYLSGLASAFTTYATYEAAQTAAVALSESNANAPVYTARVLEHADNGDDSILNLVNSGSPSFVIQLASGTTVGERETARAAAISTSASNAGATAFVARVFQTCSGS